MHAEYHGPFRIAHRGVVQAAPENTLGAFEAAKELGLEGIELDVRLSRDGEVVVVHDGNLTRLTLGHPTQPSNASIASLNWEELAQIELPYANHLLDTLPPSGAENELLAICPQRLLGQEAGNSYPEALQREPRMARFMLLQDFLIWLEAAPGMIAEIEVKAPGAAIPIFRLLERSSAVSRCILFSGKEAYIDEMQKAAAQEGKPQGLRLGANIRRLDEESKKRILRMDLFEIGLNAECVSAEDISWLHENGIQVFSNLGDYPQWWEALNRLGMDGLKTNYAAAYTDWFCRK